MEPREVTWLPSDQTTSSIQKSLYLVGISHLTCPRLNSCCSPNPVSPTALPALVDGIILPIAHTKNLGLLLISLSFTPPYLICQHILFAPSLKQMQNPPTVTSAALVQAAMVLPRDYCRSFPDWSPCLCSCSQSPTLNQ